MGCTLLEISALPLTLGGHDHCYHDDFSRVYCRLLGADTCGSLLPLNFIQFPLGEMPKAAQERTLATLCGHCYFSSCVSLFLLCLEDLGSTTAVL